MSDARTVIDAIKYTDFDSMGMANDTTIGETFGAEVILAALAEAGLVIVPRVPTPDLCFKVLAALPSDWHGFQAEDIKELWHAMVEAANEQ
jgi:hypothetical protein